MAVQMVVSKVVSMVEPSAAYLAGPLVDDLVDISAALLAAMLADDLVVTRDYLDTK